MRIEKGSVVLPLPTKDIVSNEENMWGVKLPTKY